MLLKNLLDQLIYNELGNISQGKPEWSTGNFNYKRLIQCISLGYIELHKRFLLKKEIVTLQPMVGINSYVLDIANAVSNVGSSAPKYIIDTAEVPFSNSIAKIDELYDYNGEAVEFNTTKFGDDYYLINYRTLYIKTPDVDHTLSLVCRSVPGPIVLANEGELDTYNIDLPEIYTEALIYYAASRAYVNRGAENATNNESAIFSAKFEAACAVLMGTGFDPKELMVNDKLHARGFI